MKRLLTAVLVLVLLLAMQGTALAGVDWDGDPLFVVDGVKAHVSFSINGGDFVRSGGHIHVNASGHNIRLLGKGPRCVSAEVHEGGQAGYLTLITTLDGVDQPETFEVRVRVPGAKIDVVETVAPGQELSVRIVP